MQRLDVDAIAKSYPPRASLARLLGRGGSAGTTALSGVSLSVADGEIVGLVGENGAGKTTLLKCILGLVRPESGSIHVAGIAIRPGSVEHRRRIGYVSPVERSFYLRLSCRANLLFFSRLYGGSHREVAARVERALASVDLSGRADDRVDALSSGMRQRLALARAFLHDPALVLLDEPTRSLDPVARGHIHELILAGRSGRGVLIASHDLAEIENLCDRVVVLSKGRVVASGNVDEIRRQLQLVETYDILLDADPPAGAFGSIPADSIEVKGRSLRLRVRHEGGLADALSAVSSSGRHVVRVDRSDHALEEAIRRGGGA